MFRGRGGGREKKGIYRDLAFRDTLQRQRAGLLSPVLVCCALWLATAEKEGKQIRARRKGNAEEQHAREAVARAKGGRRVRPGCACQTSREIAFASPSARSTPSRGQSSQLTLSSAQRG